MPRNPILSGAEDSSSSPKLLGAARSARPRRRRPGRDSSPRLTANTTRRPGPGVPSGTPRRRLGAREASRPGGSPRARTRARGWKRFRGARAPRGDWAERISRRGCRGKASAWRPGTRARAVASPRPCARAAGAASFLQTRPPRVLSRAEARTGAGKCGTRWAGSRARARPAQEGGAGESPDNVTRPAPNQRPARPRPLRARNWLGSSWWAGPAVGLGRAGGGEEEEGAGGQ